MTGGLSVFVASSHDALPGTAVLPLSVMEQDLLDSPQETTNKQASQFLMSGMVNNLCFNGSVSDAFYDMVGDDFC